MKLELEYEGRTITLGDRNVIVCGDLTAEIDVVANLLSAAEKQYPDLEIYPARGYYNVRRVASDYCPNLPRLKCPSEYMPEAISDDRQPKGIVAAWAHNFYGEFDRVSLMSLQLIAAQLESILILATPRTYVQINTNYYAKHMSEILDSCSFYDSELALLAGEVAA